MKHTHPFFNLVVITLVVFGSSVVAQFLGIVVASLLFNKDLADATNILLDKINNYAYQREILWIVQGFSLLFGLGGGAFLYQYWVASESFQELNTNKKLDKKAIGAVIALFIFILPLIAQVAQWNREINFGSFDRFVRQAEADLALLTEKITRMYHIGDLLIVMIIIALIPALAEEYLFRGLIQNQFLRWFGNTHWAVWITAIVFSAVHLQFLGFFPRMILGALLGYVYAWSGNITYAIVGHFTNNAVQALLLYFAQSSWINPQIAQEKYEYPFWILAISFAAVTATFRLFLHRMMQKTS